MCQMFLLIHRSDESPVPVGEMCIGKYLADWPCLLPGMTGMWHIFTNMTIPIYLLLFIMCGQNKAYYITILQTQSNVILGDFWVTYLNTTETTTS